MSHRLWFSAPRVVVTAVFLSSIGMSAWAQSPVPNANGPGAPTQTEPAASLGRGAMLPTERTRSGSASGPGTSSKSELVIGDPPSNLGSAATGRGSDEWLRSAKPTGSRSVPIDSSKTAVPRVASSVKKATELAEPKLLAWEGVSWSVSMAPDSIIRLEAKHASPVPKDLPVSNDSGVSNDSVVDRTAAGDPTSSRVASPKPTSRGRDPLVKASPAQPLQLVNDGRPRPRKIAMLDLSKYDEDTPEDAVDVSPVDTSLPVDESIAIDASLMPREQPSESSSHVGAASERPLYAGQTKAGQTARGALRVAEQPARISAPSLRSGVTKGTTNDDAESGADANPVTVKPQFTPDSIPRDSTWPESLSPDAPSPMADEPMSAEAPSETAKPSEPAKLRSSSELATKRPSSGRRLRTPFDPTKATDADSLSQDTGTGTGKASPFRLAATPAKPTSTEGSPKSPSSTSGKAIETDVPSSTPQSSQSTRPPVLKSADEDMREYLAQEEPTEVVMHAEKSHQGIDAESAKKPSSHGEDGLGTPQDAPKPRDRSVKSPTIGTPEQVRRLQRVEKCLDYYLDNPETTAARSPWAVMHALLAFGNEYELVGPKGRVNAIGWMCHNGLCRTQRMFTPRGASFVPNVGGGVQGHQGQFLAILAQCQVPPDYPIQIGEKKFTVEDLVRYEMATCKEKSELTFKLIGLSYYLDSNKQWRANDGKVWSLQKLIQEELAQPIVGAACGGTHRLMGLSFAIKQRVLQGQPVQGQYVRAAKFINEYIQYTWRLQNPDGSFSTNWYEGRGNEPKEERKVQTSGHMLEWLMFTVSDSELRSPRVEKAVDFLLAHIYDKRDTKWPIGPRGHATRALALYAARMAEPLVESVDPSPGPQATYVPQGAPGIAPSALTKPTAPTTKPSATPAPRTAAPQRVTPRLRK